MAEHIKMTETVGLKTLEHAAHCDQCYATHIATLFPPKTHAQELALDIVNEFRNGARVVYGEDNGRS